MELNNDEIRRQLREVDAMQREAQKGFGEALKRIFDPASGVDTATKAELLGVPVPGRRSFLKFGGATVLGAAVLAACSSDSNKTASTGTTTTTAAASSSGGDGAAMDLVLAKTAASLEALAIEAYKTAAGSGLVKTAAVGAAAGLFMDHHKQHLDALNGVITGAGQAAYTTPNKAVNDAVVAPAVAKAASEADILKLALTLETAAAQTYVYAAGVLSTPGLRSTLMTISGVEARHKAILSAVLKTAPGAEFPASFYESDFKLPAAAVIK